MRSGETFQARASAEAQAAPIWMIGPSRPSEPPEAMTAIDEAPRASEGRSRTVRRPSETTSIMCEMPERVRSPKKKRAMSPPTRPPAAGSKTRIQGSSASAPRRMSPVPMSSVVRARVSHRKAIAPRPPATPATAARIRNWVLGSRQKKRPNFEGRVGASGELILHLRSGQLRLHRSRSPRRKRKRGSSPCRRRCCRPCVWRTHRRPTYGRSGSEAGRRGTPARRCRNGPRGRPPEEYKAGSTR